MRREALTRQLLRQIYDDPVLSFWSDPNTREGFVMSLASLVKQAEKFLTDNSPQILTGIGVAGTIATAVLASRASFRASEVIEEDAQVNRHNPEYQYNMKRAAKLVWPLYLPSVVTGGCTIAAIIFANKIGTRRAAAIAAAYTISQEAFDEYKGKVLERIGETKEQKIRDEVAQDRVDRHPLGQSPIILASGGDTLCFESHTGRYFHSDLETLRKAENDINRQIRHQGYASLSDFYDMIGIPHTAVSDDVGWNLDNDMEMDTSAAILNGGKPCIVVTYPFAPVRRFQSLV